MAFSENFYENAKNRKCPSCFAMADDDASFCARCGKALAPKTSKLGGLPKLDDEDEDYAVTIPGSGDGFRMKESRASHSEEPRKERRHSTSTNGEEELPFSPLDEPGRPDANLFQQAPAYDFSDSALARGLPSWTIESPHVMVMRKGRK